MDGIGLIAQMGHNPDMDQDPVDDKTDLAAQGDLQEKADQLKKVAAVIGNDAMQEVIREQGAEGLLVSDGDLTKKPPTEVIPLHPEGEESALMAPEEQAPLHLEEGLPEMMPAAEQIPMHPGDKQEMKRIEQSQQAAGKQSFRPSRRKRKGGLGFGGWLCRVLGHAITGVLSAVASVFTGIAGGVMAIRRNINWKGPKQEKILHMIPGSTKQELFEELHPEADANEDQAIIDDQRRIPILWERLYPGNPEDKPYLTVDVAQGKEGSDEAWGGGATGHSSLSLFYSRKSVLTGKKERYKIKYGFAMKGGFTGKEYTVSEAAWGAMVPGQLLEDSGFATTVGKRYNATNKQINQILVESEKYPDKGYNNIKRNCTTFVADVTRSAGINTGDIFKEEDFNMGKLWLATPALSALAPITSQKNRDNMAGKFNVPDMSYARFGQKLMTGEEYRKFTKYDYTQRLSGYSPGAVAENIRRGGRTLLHGDAYGKTESRAYDVRLVEERKNLMKSLKSVMPDQESAGKILAFYSQMQEKEQKILSMKLSDGRTISDMRNYVTFLEEYREFLSNWYYDEAGGDDRLNIPFVHFISLLEQRIEKIEMLYQYDYGEKESVDYDRDTSDYLSKLKSTVMIVHQENSTEGIGDMSSLGTTTLGMAAYIHVYGSLLEAVKSVSRMHKLKNKRDRTPAEERELSKMERKENVVRNFELAESYHATREKLDQKEADYAFIEMPEKEKGINSPIPEAETRMVSKTYQALAFEKVFGGLKRALTDDAIKEYADASEAPMRMLTYMNIYLQSKAEENAEVLKLIANSLMRKNKALDPAVSPENVYGDFIYSLKSVYLEPILFSVANELYPNEGVRETLVNLMENYEATAGTDAAVYGAGTVKYGLFMAKVLELLRTAE